MGYWHSAIYFTSSQYETFDGVIMLKKKKKKVTATRNSIKSILNTKMNNKMKLNEWKSTITRGFSERTDLTSLPSYSRLT